MTEGVCDMNNAIYLEAERLRKKHNTRDPFELLEAANVVVDFTRKFPKNGLKGFCTIINRTRYVVINARLCEEEQRVVAGHEAGHIILHMDDLKIGAFKDSDIYQAKGLNGGEPYAVCPQRAYERYAKDDLPKVRELGFSGLHYVDELTAYVPEKCADPDHPVSRKKAQEYYRKIAQLSRALFGGYQSEGFMDFMSADVDAILYVGCRSKATSAVNPLFDEGIPFWQLVYHGIATVDVNTYQTGQPLGFVVQRRGAESIAACQSVFTLMAEAAFAFRIIPIEETGIFDTVEFHQVTRQMFTGHHSGYATLVKSQQSRFEFLFVVNLTHIVGRHRPSVGTLQPQRTGRQCKFRGSRIHKHRFGHGHMIGLHQSRQRFTAAVSHTLGSIDHTAAVEGGQGLRRTRHGKIQIGPLGETVYIGLRNYFHMMTAQHQQMRHRFHDGRVVGTGGIHLRAHNSYQFTHNVSRLRIVLLSRCQRHGPRPGFC